MTKLDKLLPNRIRNNPKAVTFEELRTLLEAYGFELFRVSGSHHVFILKVAGEEIMLVIPFRRGHINPSYVRKALKVIDQIEGSNE